MKKIGILFFLLITFLACKESPNATTLLNGGDWEFKEYYSPASDNDFDWQSAKVPGSVQTDLLNLGKIPDPFILNNEDSIQWVSEKNWCYKKEFSVSAEILKKQHHVLKFEGLDTYAMITLNDSVLLFSNNAFRSYELAISKFLKAENTLKVTFYSPNNLEKNKASKLNYTLPEAPRVFTRKPQFQYGWDWGPTIKTMGIWRDVSLLSYDNVTLDDIFIETNSVEEIEATLTAHISLKSVTPSTRYSVEIINNTTDTTITQPIEVYGGEGNYTIPFNIKNPKLWWTHNLGEPFLYDFTINLKKGNNVIQTLNKKVGIRTIELVTEKDSIGESFYFKLNDKAVYMKGANYIPQNIFLAEVTPQQRETLLDDAVNANMNMLRVWGGGVYESDEFYDLCDEKGLLVWQDFMFACAMYPGDAAFLNNIKAEAIDNVKRLRQHPSIALFCGNNENSEGWHRWGWQADKTKTQKQEIWNNYQAVFNDLLPNVVDSLSPTISYWETSPKYGRGDKRYQFEGDAHDWWVWHDGYPFEHFEESVPRFMSEFGFQSFPSYEVIQYFTQQDSIDLNHSSFATHQKHARGFQLIKEYMARDFPVPTDDADYVYVSQLVQAYGITKGIRAHRAAKPYNMGTLYWQLNDCWPVVSWSSIDGLGNWKALHYKAKRAFENRIIVPFEENDTLKIKVVDDNFETITEDLYVVIKDFYGDILEEYKQRNIATFTNKNEVVFELPLSQTNFDSTKSYAHIFFGNSEAVHYFESPKNLALDQENLDATMVKTSYGYEIRLHANTLQKDVFLYSETKGFFEDNFIDVLPNQSKIVKFNTQEEETPIITYKSLNQLQQFKVSNPQRVRLVIDPTY